MMKADNSNADHEDYVYYGELQTNLTAEDVLDSYEVNLYSNYILAFYGVGL